MRGANPGEARTAFLTPLRRAVSCVSPTVLIAARTGPAGAESWSTADDVVRVKSAVGDLQLRLQQAFCVAEDPAAPSRALRWEVALTGYEYQVLAGDGEVAWHWHPWSTNREPHLHVSAGPLAGVHLPSGPVGLEAVLRVLIGELGVSALREDWEQVLAAGAVPPQQWRRRPTPP